MIAIKELREVIEILNSLKVPYYFHAGFALSLLGLKGELDDCDVRVYHPNIQELYQYIRAKSAHPVQLRGSMIYQNGVYQNECIEILNETKFDICTKMMVECDIGRFEFPFDKKNFNDIVMVPFQGMILPVASYETLLLYYLILRRGITDGKNDEEKIKTILFSEKFRPEKFEKMISNLPDSKKVQELYLKVTS